MEEHITDDNQSAEQVVALTAELEALRLEKQRRLLLDSAREGLRARGLDAGFAPFLLGEDEKLTARNIGEFEKHFTAALAGEMVRRLPKEAPTDFSSDTGSKGARRGIRKV